MRIAQNLFNKLGDLPKHTKKKASKSTVRCLEDLATYIDNLRNEHINKSYLDEYLIGAVFKTEIYFKTDSEINQYCKCQLFLADLWLKSLIKKIERDGGLSHNRILRYKDHIGDFLHDIKRFIEYLERKKNKDFVFFEGSKYYGQYAWQIFSESNVLYWLKSNEKSSLSHRSAINLSVFTLRQSLELKFRKVLGLIYIHDKNGTSAKIKHEYIPEFLEKNLTELEVNYDSINGVIKIYKWTNSTIHTGIIPYIWELDFALDYCSNLFTPDESSSNGYWSIHSSVKIKNYDRFINRFVNGFCKDYSDKYWCFIFL